MDKPVDLIPLVCIRCSTPIPAESDELAWVCTQCGQGMQLDISKGLVALQIHSAAGIPANQKGKPYWIADARVVLQRQTFSGNSAGEAQDFWAAPRRFFIPAFDCSLETMLSLGMQMLTQPPLLSEGPPATFEPVKFSSADVRSLAEFIVVAVEASRRDMLKELQFDLDLSDPILWVLP